MNSAPPWPAAAGAPLVLLTFTGTAEERRLVDAWMERARPPQAPAVSVVAAGGAGMLEAGLDTGLRAGEEALVAPVRVAWLPEEGDGRLLSRLTTLVSRRHPGRGQVIVGEPATVAQLRRRFEEQRGNDRFGEFVARQGTLALERAERALVGDQHKVPRLVVEDILGSARLQAGVERLARELGRPEAEVAERVGEALREMVATQDRRAVDLWDHLGRWGSRAYTVEADTAALDDLRLLNQRHPLAFLPSHKSYLDPLVLRSALHDAGFPPNHILGGINIDFWPIGPLARRSGIVFIRRSIADDPIYKFAFREYLGYLVAKRFNLEWYIEGGRSRTGKLRPPRLGALAYLVDAYRDGRADDVLLVPTSIAYDQLHEVAAMAAEATGAAKQPEGLAWALRYVRAQGQRLGTARVRFGEPISLRQSLGPADQPRGRAPSRQAPNRHAIEKLAFQVCHRINQATPITPTSLVTLALLGVGERALTLPEICDALDPLLEYVAVRKLPVAGEVELGTAEGVLGTLGSLCRHKVVTRFDEGTEPVYAITAGGAPGPPGPDQHLVAAYYRNAVIHFFVNRALTELILVWAASHPLDDPFTAAWAEALRLRDLFKFEFFFAPKPEFAQELREELAMLDPAWEQRAGEPAEIWAGLGALRLHLAHRVLRPFAEAYQVVADRLAAQPPGAPLDEKRFLTDCIGVARQYRLQQRIHSPESISKELFATAWQLAASRGLVEPGGEELNPRRRAFAAEVAEVVRRIGVVERLALEALPGA